MLQNFNYMVNYRGLSKGGFPKGAFPRGPGLLVIPMQKKLLEKVSAPKVKYTPLHFNDVCSEKAALEIGKNVFDFQVTNFQGNQNYIYRYD